MALTPEEQNELDAINAELQQRAEDFRRNYKPSPEEIKEARQLTGLEDSSALYRFNAGLVQSGKNLLKAPGRIITRVFGDDEAIKANEQEVDEERRLMEAAGTAGKVGQFTGDFVQGFVPGLGGVNMLRRGGALAKGAVGGLTGGATGGLLQPVGSGESGILNTAVGGIGGAALGTAGAAALKGVSSLRNTFSKNANVQKHFDDVVGRMTDSEMEALNAIKSKLGTSDPFKYRFTPASAIQHLSTQKSSQAKYIDKLRKLPEAQQMSDIEMLGSITRTFPDASIVKNTSIGNLVKTYEDLSRYNANVTTAPLYKVLNDRKAPASLTADVVNNTNTLKLFQEVLDNGHSFNPTEIQNFKRIINASKKSKGPVGDAPSLADYNVFRTYINRELKLLDRVRSSGNQLDRHNFDRFRQLQNAKATIDRHLLSDPDFVAANSAYEKAKEPLNDLYSSELYRSFTKNKSDAAYSTKGKTLSKYTFGTPSENKQLGSDIYDFNPEMYHNVMASKANSVLDNLDTLKPNQVVKELNAVQAFAHKEPEAQLTINILKGAFEESNKSPARFQLLNALTHDKNKRAMIELLSNPNQYRKVLRQALQNNDREKALLNTINTIAAGAGGIATASPEAAMVGTYATGAAAFGLGEKLGRATGLVERDGGGDYMR